MVDISHVELTFETTKAVQQRDSLRRELCLSELW